jgi:hypothetical protein
LVEEGEVDSESAGDAKGGVSGVSYEGEVADCVHEIFVLVELQGEGGVIEGVVGKCLIADYQQVCLLFIEVDESEAVGVKDSVIEGGKSTSKGAITTGEHPCVVVDSVGVDGRTADKKETFVKK